MNIRQKKKRAKNNIVKAVGSFFGHKIRTKHLRLMGVINNNGYLYDHNGCSIRVTARNEEKEQEIREESPDLPDEAAGQQLSEDS